jgi:hypothetical protein
VSSRSDRRVVVITDDVRYHHARGRGALLPLTKLGSSIVSRDEFMILLWNANDPFFVVAARGGKKMTRDKSQCFLTGSERLQMAKDYLSFAAEMQASILENLGANRKQACLAEFRPFVESCLRGLWILFVASTPKELGWAAGNKQNDLVKLAEQIDCKLKSLNFPPHPQFGDLRRLLKGQGSDKSPLIAILHQSVHVDMIGIRRFRQYELKDVADASRKLLDLFLALYEVMYGLIMAKPTPL